MIRTYQEFKDAKLRSAHSIGFCDDRVMDHGWLHPFQRAVTKDAIAHGRFGVFGSTGTGKTRIEGAVADSCADRTNKPSLLLNVLGTVGQTINELSGVGLDVSRGPTSKIQVINYGQIKNIDPSLYGSVLLDESSILKDFASATKRLLCEMFASTPYRFAFSATPSPNDHTELGNHAEFLGVMSMQSMLARWFVHDSMNTSEWRLKGHAGDDFWQWVASWAVAFRLPSDLNSRYGMEFSDDGYILPPLTLTREIVQVAPADSDALISDARLSASTMHKEMRRTAEDRAAAVARIIAKEPNETWAIWCETDYEADALKSVVDNLTEVSGSMSDTVKEDRLLGFANGKIPRILTKSSIAGHGLNWQICARTVFVGASYSFERVHQALRRFWRYGQTREVMAYLVSADTEWSVLESTERKSEKHDTLISNMIAQMGNGVKALEVNHKGADIIEKDWSLLRGDNVERIKAIPDSSVGYCIFSPPFASLYTYTDAPEDMGNCQDDQEFLDHFGFLVPEIKRVMMPGRLVSIHCMDLPSTIERNGVTELRDFPGELIALFKRHGFLFHSRVTIWKDPLVAMQRTKAIGLLHKQLCKDSSKSRQGIADYLVTMRVPGDNPEPISHGAGFDRYIGEDGPKAKATDDPKTNKYGHEVWQRYASPVWMDINPTDVLPYTGARESKDERHICPLQLQCIERGVELWSNPGDLVLDPFNGVGSSGYVALRNGRRYVGIELKESYFNQAVLNLSRAATSVQSDLFGDDVTA